MIKYSTRIISDSGVLVIAMMLSNGLNFVYNAYLGRVLTFEEFGLITLVNTFLFLATMFLGAYGATINHRVSYLLGAHNKEAAAQFFLKTRNQALVIVGFVTILWVIFSSSLGTLFQISDPQITLFFSPVFLLLVVLIAGRTYLQGTLAFGIVALIYLTESITKLVSVFILVGAGMSTYAYLSIPFSILCAAIVCGITLYGRTPVSKSSDIVSSDLQFPTSFYLAAIFSGLSTTAFLSIDVLLAKHFLSPTAAGEYSLLSLVGKMVFFLGSLFNSFMVTFVSRDMGKGRSTNGTFYMLLCLEAFVTLSAFVLFGLMGDITVPFLFGSKALAIVPFVTLYTFGIALFTLTNTIVQYRLIRHNYVFPITAIITSVLMFVGILLVHDNVQAISRVVAFSSIIGFLVISIMHVMFEQGKFILRNFIDLFDLFSTVGNENHNPNTGKKVLIFNWRDIRHERAGGAEVYIHELAKRWVTEGVKVTLFCGNDGKCPRYEEIDGVEVVRRGGFYFVYVWAFLYYVFKFRGKYDVIVDCENGIPFFTPLYTRERQYLVIHHVHQEVFRKSLPGPLAQLAIFFETKLMPYVYESVQIITVSPSSKTEIEELGLTKEDIHVVYNGIDINHFVPQKKNERPNVLYLGRLKSYKSVDVFVKAAQKIIKVIPDVEFVIAGDGEERKKLEQLADKLGLKECIRFVGKVTEDMKVKLYQEAWVFVNPSFREGWGITTIEANACGTPVVASRVPGLIDSVKNPHTGYLVEYGNDSEFAEQITKLLLETDLRSAMSQEAIAWAKEFSWDASAKRALEVLYHE